MSRCVVCDYCDTAGSVSTTQENFRSIRWDEKMTGFVCDKCADDPSFDPEYVDLDFSDIEED